jgi:heme/copper-type cytochrome/quinol oxidase subunit 2
MIIKFSYNILRYRLQLPFVYELGDVLDFCIDLNKSFYEKVSKFFIGDKYASRSVSFFSLNIPFFDFVLKCVFLVFEKNLLFFLYPFMNRNFFFYDDFYNYFKVLKFKHSFFLELLWAAFPISVIAYILIPSFLLIFSMDAQIDPDLAIKVFARQWFWIYEFDNFVSNIGRFISFNFDSSTIVEEDLESSVFYGSKRLLEVDNRLLLPLNRIVQTLITSGDVLHAWSVPELGVKVDAVPGRINHFLILMFKPGIFFGQCSELCGVAHGFMPVVVSSTVPSAFDHSMSFACSLASDVSQSRPFLNVHSFAVISEPTVTLDMANLSIEVGSSSGSVSDSSSGSVSGSGSGSVSVGANDSKVETPEEREARERAYMFKWFVGMWFFGIFLGYVLPFSWNRK